MKKLEREDCFHEAGHTAIFWLLGMFEELVSVDVQPTRSRAGCAKSHGWRRSPEFLALLVDYYSPRQVTVHLARIVMISLAGPCAQNKVGKHSKFWLDELIEEDWAGRRRNESQDVVKAIRAVQFIKGANRWEPFLRKVASWTEEALSHPRLWAAVSSLAKGLKRAKRLSAYQAFDLLDAGWGDLDGSTPLSAMGKEWKRGLQFPPRRKTPAITAKHQH
jgi:hypothetical protein